MVGDDAVGPTTFCQLTPDLGHFLVGLTSVIRFLLPREVALVKESQTDCHPHLSLILGLLSRTPRFEALLDC